MNGHFPGVGMAVVVWVGRVSEGFGVADWRMEVGRGPREMHELMRMHRVRKCRCIFSFLQLASMRLHSF